MLSAYSSKDRVNQFEMNWTAALYSQYKICQCRVCTPEMCYSLYMTEFQRQLRLDFDAQTVSALAERSATLAEVQRLMNEGKNQEAGELLKTVERTTKRTED